MGLILDTNALSAIVDNQPGIADAVRRTDLIAVPVIVLGEYRYGIAQSRRRAEYERTIERFKGWFRVFDIDQATTISYAEVRVELKLAGAPIPSNDVWIAALCRQHKMPVLSRDRHFDRIRGLKRITW